MVADNQVPEVIMDFLRELHTRLCDAGVTASIGIAPLLDLGGVWYEVSITDQAARHTEWYHIEVTTGTWFVTYKY